MSYTNLNPEKALIWRIVHRDNVPWILDNGVHCRNSTVYDPNYVEIGNPDLIDKRAHRDVRVGPGGTLSDYVPFYFTPFSPMMYNIKTGYGGIRKRSNEEIVILVSSLHRVHKMGLPCVFTDRHAYPPLARYFDDLDQLEAIDWALIQRRDFQRNPDDPEKVERYQAEALVYKQLPIKGLMGIVCYNAQIKSKIDDDVTKRGLQLDVRAMPGWYF
ncbi:MAG: hypothetical protein A3H93_07195 [Rhodocyclales bacterium RIFCSPLOWO2_02_FULL_63_24]|nr:MAG: hypothetical protein A3H93_07195 [Rhodocyclales bacterium RIFCSPLOWO2_02_FULL_63_24]